MTILCAALPSATRADPLDDSKSYFKQGESLRAINIWYRLAQHGNALAEFNLGVVYRFGFGITQDNAAANLYFKEAANKGFAAGKEDRWRIFFGPISEYASTWFQEDPDEGDPKGQTFLAHLEGSIKETLRQNAESTRSVESDAERGDYEAQITLGQRYADGVGVPRDDARAVKWFRVAELDGHAAAAFFLAAAYMDGRGVARNYKQGVEWARKAAGGELTCAWPEGVLPTTERSAGFAPRCVDTAIPGAQILLGLAYAEGLGVRRNYAVASSWFRRAARTATGQLYLGLAYANGQGMPRDEGLAREFLQRASVENPLAKTYLALLGDRSGRRRPIPLPWWDGLSDR